MPISSIPTEEGGGRDGGREGGRGGGRFSGEDKPANGYTTCTHHFNFELSKAGSVVWIMLGTVQDNIKTVQTVEGGGGREGGREGAREGGRERGDEGR